MNLARSKLCFDMLVPLQGSITTFNNVYANALSLIDRITLTYRSAVVLADIPNTHVFGNLVSTANTQLSDLMTRTTLNSATTMPQGTITASTSATHADTLASNVSAVVASQLCPVSDLVRCNGTVNAQASALVHSLVALTPGTEPVQIFTGAVIKTSNAISYQIDLSAFKDTIM